MKRIVVVAIALAGALAIAGCATGRYAQYDRPHPVGTDSLSQMQQQDVIALSKEGVSDSLIIAMIDYSGSWFDLKTSDIVRLKKEGVSERVINAMIATNMPTADRRRPSYDAWYRPYPYWYNWYAGFYPYWYYPSFYVGYPYYRPGFVYRYAHPHRTWVVVPHAAPRSGGRRR